MTAGEDPTPTALDVVQRFHQAMLNWDEVAMRELIHSDAELHQPDLLPYGGIYRGPDEMLALWTQIMNLLDGATASVEYVLSDRERVSAVARSKTTASGRDALVSEDYLVRDGRIDRIRVFWFDPTPLIDDFELASSREDRPVPTVSDEGQKT